MNTRNDEPTVLGTVARSLDCPRRGPECHYLSKSRTTGKYFDLRPKPNSEFLCFDQAFMWNCGSLQADRRMSFVQLRQAHLQRYRPIGSCEEHYRPRLAVAPRRSVDA